MTRRHLSVVIAVCFSIMFVLTSVTSEPATMQSDLEVSSEFSPADYMGEPPMTARGVENWNFEEAESDGRPSNWQTDMDTYSRANLSDTAQVHGGTYAASLLVDPSPAYDSVYIVYGFSGNPVYLTSNMDLAAWTYPQGTNAGTETYIYLSLQNSTGYDFYMYYYLDWPTEWVPSNSTTGSYSYTYVDSSGLTKGQWNQFSANPYSTIVDQHGMIDQYTELFNIQAQLYPNVVTGNRTHYYFDDFSLNNGTEYFTKGDFESSPGTHWYSGGAPHDPSSVTLGSLSTHGMYSANLTAGSTLNSSQSGAQLYRRQYNLQDREFVSDGLRPIVEFDWNLSFQGLNDNDAQAAYFRIRFQDPVTFSNYYIFLVFGSGGPGSLGWNDTNYRYFKSPNYNVTGVWHHAVLDLYSLLSDWGYGNLSIYGYSFYVDCDYMAGSSLTLLVDNFNLNVYPTVDPGFEFHRSTDEFDSWRQSHTGTPYVNWTDDARSGDYAANITASSGQYRFLRREMYLDVTPSLTTDFYWRLDQLSGTGAADSYIFFEFDQNLGMYYMLSSFSSFDSGWNSSTELWYPLAEMNDVGTSWKHFTRSVYNDVQAFTVMPNYIRRIQFTVSTGGSGMASLVLDDINFVIDQTPPSISNIVGPTSPNYLTSPAVTTQATDSFSGVSEVLIHYDAGAGWTATSMADQSTHWAGSIPEQPYATTVDYYIEAIDTEGNSRIDDNSGSYYSYTVIDDVDPELAFTDPIWYGASTGSLLVNMSADDPGSGIAHLELFIDEVSVENFTSPPFQYVWNTRDVLNGAHAVRLFAIDTAGNDVNLEVSVETHNDLQGPVISGVTLSPETPVFDLATIVQASVFDESDIESVTLYYDSGSGYTALEMEATGSLYSAEIPELPWNTEVSYYIEAVDEFGEISRTIGDEIIGHPTYVVGDPYVPSISVSGPPVTQSLRGTVQFVVYGNDYGSGIASVGVLVDGSSVGTGSSVPFAFSWDTTTVENGNYTLTFVLTDAAGNVAMAELEYMVENPVGLGVVTSLFTDLLQQYGFIVGATTVIVLYIVVKLIGRRRASGK